MKVFGRVETEATTVAEPDRNRALLQSSFISTTADSVWTNKAVEWLTRGSSPSPLSHDFAVSPFLPDFISCAVKKTRSCSLTGGNSWPWRTSVSCRGFYHKPVKSQKHSIDFRNLWTSTGVKYKMKTRSFPCFRLNKKKKKRPSGDLAIRLTFTFSFVASVVVAKLN